MPRRAALPFAHVYGAVGAGRDDNPKMLSAGCQFYIVANKNGLARLDDKYTVYGRVIKGMDAVEAVVSALTDRGVACPHRASTSP